MRLLGRLTAVAGVTAAAMVAAPQAALATASVGQQNPHLVVAAQFYPTHADVGERVTWSVVITNASSRTRSVEFDVTVETPWMGEDEGGLGELPPHTSITLHHTFRARQGGTYTMTASAQLRRGVASHAAARVFV